MTIARGAALPLLALLLAGAAPPADPALTVAAERVARTAAHSGSPEDLYGPLYDAVELARVFPDSKTFADLVPRDPPATIMEAWQTEHPSDKAALTAFVVRHFIVPAEGAPAKLDLRAHIRSLWPVLAKAPMAVVPGSSALQLRSAYVVPGGRYQEIYYWDSYFTMLGLKADGEQPLIEGMIDNFVSLVERYGHVPNGTRTYYLGRSQPPYLSLMMDLSSESDPAILRRRLAALRAEHSYWMAGATCLARQGACQHVVRMPDGSLLNRYWDARDTPRDESYTEDRATAAAAAPRPVVEVNRDLRAGGETGWDFSSRWLRDGKTLATIHTTDIVPIDLNSLLWTLEKSIARRCRAAGDIACAQDFERQAAARRVAMSKYLWIPGEQRFADWDRSTKAPTPVISAAMLSPLFAGLATQEQADATARLTEARLVAPGGLRTTLMHTGQQWDEPNGWAPLQWIAVSGLDRYGHKALADSIATRWLRSVSSVYACSGRMVEKYDVDSGKPGGGGEYPLQDGFGWTNGVTRVLLDRPRPASASPAVADGACSAQP